MDNNKQEGKILCKRGVKVGYLQDGRLKDGGYFSYQLTIIIQKEKFKYLIDEIYHFENPHGPECGNLGLEIGDCDSPWKSMIWRELKLAADKELQRVTRSLETAVMN